MSGAHSVGSGMPASACPRASAASRSRVSRAAATGCSRGRGGRLEVPGSNDDELSTAVERQLRGGWLALRGYDVQRQAHRGQGRGGTRRRRGGAERGGQDVGVLE